MADSENRSETALKEAPFAFIHIFKAAGTSVQLQLRGKFGVQGVPKVNDGPGFPDRVKEALSMDGVKVVAGHFRYFRIAQAFGAAGYETPVCFSFIREPVSRIISAYNYFNSNPAEKWHKEAKEMDLNSFIEFLVEADPDAIVNHQCKALSENMEGSFEAAQHNIEKNFGFVGCVDNLPASNLAAQSLLGVQFDAGVRKNESLKKQGREALSGKVLSLLQDVMAEDKKLYEHVNNKFE